MFLRIATGLALSLVLPLHSAMAQTPAPGGILRAVVQPEPVTLNPGYNNSYVNGVVATNVLEGLLTYDKDHKPGPSLATAWKVAPDALSIEFTLRKEVKWHDGRPFTSADVKYSALEVWKKVHPIGRNILADLDDVATPDDHTAVLKFKRPALVVLNFLNAQGLPVLPRHLYENTDVRTNPYNQKPVGTGAFKFKSWSKGQQIDLVRNEDYWDKGKPYLDGIVFRIIPDAAARSAALETGEVDYIPWDSVPLNDVERLQKLPSLAVTYQGYSWQSNYLVLEFNLRRPELAHPTVRHAIAHAINRPGLTRAVWYNLGTPSASTIPSSLKQFYTTDKVPQYPYDPQLANRLLDQAGYPRQANGVRFSIHIDYAPFNQNFGRHAEYLKQNLKQVGIEVDVRNQDLASYLKRVYTDYDFDLQTTRWAPYIDPQLGGLRQFWTQTISKGTPWQNASGYANPELDAIIDKIRYATRQDDRYKAFGDFQRIAQRDIPALALYEEKNFTVYNRKVHGLSDDADASQASLKTVWIQR
ncbi:peptide/nickel transport system substrate-binding protein [Comamonas sp. BIGb0124]|nr:peptide/nickel transport system substrate-binding protein [Comamonas sp. BIGb0124]